MKKLIVLCGVPCMGKSTTASYLSKNMSDTVLVSRDKVRQEIGETQYNTEGHAKVRSAFHSKIIDELKKGNSVIADGTHLNKHSRSHLIKIAEEQGAEPHAIYLEDKLENLKERNAKRPKSKRVPNEALENMYLDYQIPSKIEGFKDVHKAEIFEKK